MSRRRFTDGCVVELLFVDDNATNLKVYTTIAARIAGAHSQTFVSSAAALVWCESHEPDLIVLDYRMPAPDGIEFIRRYRLLYPQTDTPIIMITGERDREVRHRALESGASDFLNKPADPVEFLTRMRNLLALRERGRQLENRAATLAAEVRAATREIAGRELETITRLMRAMEYRDNETGMHVMRMGQYAETLGRALGLSTSEQQMLLLATPMHDIGKVATPDCVLLKPGPLAPPEWEIMKDHAQVGHAILAGSASKVLQLAAEIARGHHERWDGTGYPDAVKGTDIPLSARICAVGDVFDALVSKRPYKEAWTPAAAFKAIEKTAGTHFDPLVVDAFMRSKDEIERILQRLLDAVVAA
jgi:response regulator RpfG family c-di-GMP phosphodiesterase